MNRQQTTKTVETISKQNNSNNKANVIRLSGGMSTSTQTQGNVGAQKAKIGQMRRNTALCKWGSECQFGNVCIFAHDPSELVSVEEQYASVYRTRPCRSWQQTGSCTYGVKCFFQHGSSSNASKPSEPIKKVEANYKKPLTEKNGPAPNSIVYYPPRGKCAGRLPSPFFEELLADFENHQRQKNLELEEQHLELPPIDRELYANLMREKSLVDPLLIMRSPIIY